MVGVIFQLKRESQLINIFKDKKGFSYLIVLREAKQVAMLHIK
jgi:hypothetical protein